ncbi:protein PIGBOS1 [Spea bombifrons]|uniref:protein PIGBOS1 n=1 Tax=Spea bombifrons TaxID=233779 RepID=UPI0023498CC3|nr:protein PIGBOS1 [Spea bombifrons]
MFRGLSFPQLFLATFLGVAGGVYIYKPIYEQYYWEKKTLKADANSPELVKNEE